MATYNGEDIITNGIETLPPAGHARNEELKKRADQLAEKAENQEIEREAVPHDHPSMRPEENREIQNHIYKSHLEIGQEHPYLKVKWVNYVNQQGTMIWQEKSRGWQIATPREFPEANDMGLAREDNSIRAGDVMLMCIRMDQYLINIKKEEEKRLKQQYGVEADIHNFAAKHSDVFGAVHTPNVSGVPDRIMNKMEQRSGMVNMAASRTAARHIGNRMKKGTIPGVPIR